MKTDVNGCSTCPNGQEHYEKFKSSSRKLGTMYQYDYRKPTGELFSTVAKTLEECRSRRDAWLSK